MSGSQPRLLCRSALTKTQDIRDGPSAYDFHLALLYYMTMHGVPPMTKPNTKINTTHKEPNENNTQSTGSENCP